jgi:hypothetical protein
VNAVVEEAKKAKKEMETKNPDLKLKHDPTKILPTSGGLNFNHHHHHHHHLHPEFHPPGLRMAVRMFAEDAGMPFIGIGPWHQVRPHVPNPNTVPHRHEGRHARRPEVAQTRAGNVLHAHTTPVVNENRTLVPGHLPGPRNYAVPQPAHQRPTK